ncbi:MAG TPA: molybdopterin cofactor-binding domain-containing protein, partial [Polyangiales bacterium]
PAPRSMQRAGQLVGWGMATGVWEALFQATSARAVLATDGTLTVSTASSDIGTGTYTILAQIASETSGVPLEKVRVELGDSSLPTAPLEGGSWTAASAGAAVQLACARLRAELDKGPPTQELRIEVTSEPEKARQEPYSRATHSAVFAEVEVDPLLGVVRVTRVVSAIAAGRILNPKTARSQILGGIVWGISMALHEHTRMDGALGRYVNHDLAEYHIPVQADVHDLEVLFVDETDDIVSPLGVKGVGEIGIVGVAAAISNAVFHATGKRVRELPITLDKLL